MAEGRDIGPRSPRWLNGLIWTSGLGATVCFVWKLVTDGAEPTVMPPGLSTLLPLILSCIMLPFLLVSTLLGRGLRRGVG